MQSNEIEKNKNDQIDPKQAVSKTDLNEEPQISQEDKTERKHKLREILKEHLTNEMFGALLEVFYSPHRAIKIFSILFLIVSYGLASYTTIKLILGYFDYGVTSTVRTIYETPAVFPKVTICNVNQMTTQYGYEFLKNITNNTFESFPINSSTHDDVVRIFTTQVKSFSLINNLTDDAKKSLGQKLEDSLLSCQFNLVQCYPENFSWYFDAIYGNCYSFNSGFNSKGERQDTSPSYLAGSFHGLQIDFYIRSYENFSFFNSISSGSGAIIRIDNVSHVIDHIKDGIFVVPGTSTYVAINREYKTMLPKPYSDCSIDSDDKSTNSNSYLYQLIKNSIYDYTQQFCIEQCLMKLDIEMCGCQPSFFKTVINANICFSDYDINCTINVYYEVFLKSNYIQNICYPQCPLECYSNKFTYSTSSYDVNGDLYVNKIKNNSQLASDFVTEQINAETVRKSFVRINVFYDSLSYTLSEESPQWDAFSLIANIGGNLGLFLSVGFFTFCEIITFLIDLFFLQKNINKTSHN